MTWRDGVTVCVKNPTCTINNVSILGTFSVINLSNFRCTISASPELPLTLFNAAASRQTSVFILIKENNALQHLPEPLCLYILKSVGLKSDPMIRSREQIIGSNFKIRLILKCICTCNS